MQPQSGKVLFRKIRNKMGGHNLDNKEAHSIYDANRVHVLKYVECKHQYTNLAKIDRHGQTHMMKTVSAHSLVRQRNYSGKINIPRYDAVQCDWYYFSEVYVVFMLTLIYFKCTGSGFLQDIGVWLPNRTTSQSRRLPF